MSPWNLNDNSNIYISTTKSSLASTAFFESSYWITAILKDNSFYGFSLLENQIRWLQWIVPHDNRKKFYWFAGYCRKLESSLLSVRTVRAVDFGTVGYFERIIAHLSNELSFTLTVMVKVIFTAVRRCWQLMTAVAGGVTTLLRADKRKQNKQTQASLDNIEPLLFCKPFCLVL